MKQETPVATHQQLHKHPPRGHRHPQAQRARTRPDTSRPHPGASHTRRPDTSGPRRLPAGRAVVPARPDSCRSTRSARGVPPRPSGWRPPRHTQTRCHTPGPRRRVPHTQTHPRGRGPHTPGSRLGPGQVPAAHRAARSRGLRAPVKLKLQYFGHLMRRADLF